MMLRNHHFYEGWARLLFAYLASFALSFAAGVVCITILEVAPETLFEVSTKRLSYAFPVLQRAATLGLDEGVVLFAWNSLAALITISFLYTAPLFNPHTLTHSPQRIRKLFCSGKRMKLFCFLPGCRNFTEEPLRRVYVWLMIPWLGMILLGMESGLSVSTSSHLFGSYTIGFLSLIPHGIIEIPTFGFAGAISFTAHLLLKKNWQTMELDKVFQELGNYKKSVPLRNAILVILCGLFIAGLVEAHITQGIVESLQNS